MKLTKAQRLALEKAAAPGGVVGFGQKHKVVWPLRKLGLVEPLGRHGYMVITPAGRAALEEQP